VVIQRSSSAETTRLIHDLIGADPVRREAATARLAIVGERAVDRLLAALTDAAPDAGVAILRTLELIGSPRAVPAALARLEAPNDAVAVAAVSAIRPHLRATDDRVASESLEGLTALALAKRRSDPPRLAALDALDDLGSDTLQPICDRLRHDPSPCVRRAAGLHTGDPLPRTKDPSGIAPPSPDTPTARLKAAARGELPDDAKTVRALLADAGGTVALSVLHDLVLTLRAKERAVSAAASLDAKAEADGAAELDWMAARAATHQALAERHSRLAVFDLRDTFEGASARIPLGFVAAITQVGDASCLPALAAAWQRVDDRWMRDHLAAAFKAIMARDRLTRRHAIVRRALDRAPKAAEMLGK
jgi:hypothetical protein